MANGDSSHWQVIEAVRKRAEENTARIAVLESEMKTVRSAVLDSENRIIKRIDDHESETNQRFDRIRNTTLALLGLALPVITFLAGALLQSGGS